ncbi:hypothetical protein BDV24DRAFT_158621 [Aspergillus arachidicola]|uniref:MACPF domain-containing protein n=1 Tax=Aspergillus arachidicola TaxID=656916 RepID=A0A5N6YLK8_9EURO|nr:hypothetical protein BDV24DRAFT_158621 [Aspergillus arachidicola]
MAFPTPYSQWGNINQPPENQEEDHTLAFLVVTDDRKSEEVFRMKISMEDIKKESLQTLQGHIKNNSHKEYRKLPFCTAQGGSIADLDQWTIEAYLEHVNGHKPNEQPSNVYLRRKQLKVQAEDIPNINLSLPALPENLQAPKAPTILSSINKADWKAVTSINTKPQDLDQDSWKTVTFNNSLCYGLCVLHQDNGHGKSTPIGLIRAPYPAFRIKQRRVYDEEDEKEPELRVPDYIVDDQSYISIYETKTRFQSSLSKSGIDEFDISISGGLPAFGGVVGFSGGVNRSASDQTTTDESGESSQMNISYNFPRVTVRLDEYSLEITEKCKNELLKIKEKTAADDFLKKFGEYFSTQVQLGGRLFASEEFDSHSVSSAKDTKESLKVQAAASFKTPLGAGGSSSFGYGRARNEAESSSNSNLTSTLQWQANGGNTLLCNNPPEWCQTVAAYQNWRIIKRSGNRHILNLLAQFEEDDIHNQVKFLMTEEVQDPKLPVQPQAMQQARQGRMFYLRTTTMGGGSKWYKYLTAFQTAVWTNNEISALKKVKDELPERCATALLHDSVDEGRKCGIFLECRTPEQHGVTKIMYNQPYILRNPSTGLYLYLDCKANGDMFPVAMPKLPSKPTGYWYIRGVDGTEIGEAKQDTPVTIRYGKNETDAPRSFLTVFHETKWSGLLKKGENADDDEVAFTMMYKDIYEGTAKA